MKIAIGSDHAGFSLKEELAGLLKSMGHDVQDVGAFSEERTDYPDFAKKVAESVAARRVDRGVLVCGSGIGMCMAANRIHGVRAAVLREEIDAKLSREHNDANLACLGGRITGFDKAERLLEVFLSTPFEGGRHAPRIQKLDRP
ncbi:MAG: ribose 5-phosphate isomerase B [Deltaproteobacteria bacterium]|nr:ribose 5-phosphate isomerase B [Deltaproteobacteria bacterium]